MAGNYAQLLDIINNPTDHSLPAWDNNNKLIEGLTIKQYLLTIIQSLTAGYQFMGVATPSTSPGTPDQNVFYIGGAGTYENFGASISVPTGKICLFIWNGTWTNTPIDISFESFNNLQQRVLGLNVSYEDVVSQSSAKIIALSQPLYNGIEYAYTVNSGTSGVVSILFIYTDGTSSDWTNINLNQQYTLEPTKDIKEIRLYQNYISSLSVEIEIVTTSALQQVMQTADVLLNTKIEKIENISRLYPFDVAIDQQLIRPGYTNVLYSKDLNGIKFLHLDVQGDDRFYITSFYAYATGTHESFLRIANASNSIYFIYTVVRQSPSGLPTEDIEITANDGVSKLYATIDWSKVNSALWVVTGTAFPISEDCISHSTLQIDNSFADEKKAASALLTGNIGRLYPFDTPINNVLSRPNYPTQIVYSAERAGIKYLHITTSNKNRFYFSQIYAYGGEHRSVFTIKDSNDKTIFVYVSDVRPNSSSSTFPTETIELTATDGSTLKAIIDWSKINRADGIGLDATFNISESCITRVNEYCRFVPISDYYVTGEQQRIYLNEIAEYNKDGFFIFQAQGNSGQEVISGWNGECQYLEFNVTSTKDITVTITYYDGKYELIATKTITIHAVVGATLPVKKYMFIGDSLTHAGIYEKKFYDMNPDKVVLYGTIGTAPYLHEGRYGWKSSDYLTKASFNGQTNAFYNPNTQTFDFSYYMTNNPSFADVDCVVIFLGRNDGYSSGSLINNINTMIASIKAFNSNIKTYVIGAYNVACNDSGTGKYLQSHASMNHIGFNYNKDKFFVTYTPATETKPIPIHLNLDNKYDYSSTLQDVSVVDDRKMEVYVDNVHPSSIGYEKFGMAINGFFHYEFRQ